MKTFMQFLSENVVDNSLSPEPNRKMGDYMAISKAFNTPIDNANFIPSGTQNVKGVPFSSVISVLKDSKPIKWSLLKNGIEKQISLFSNFEDSVGENTFINSQDPVVKTDESGITLVWYKPYEENSDKADWKIPRNSPTLSRKAI